MMTKLLLESSELLVNLACLITKPTGISNYALSLLPYLKSLNPLLLTDRHFPDHRCYAIPANQTSEEGVKGRLQRLWWTQTQLPKLYRQLRAQLLFSPLPEAPIFTTCRYIVMAHDLLPLRFPKGLAPRTLYFRYWVPFILEQAQHILCNSNSTANDLIHFFQIPSTKITPIPLGFNSQHFQPTEVCQSGAQPYFLYLGHHEPYKNLPRLINAFAALPNHRDYQLWLVGSSDRRYTPRLKAYADELGLGQHIHFLDYVAYEQLPALISGAIALVFPSLWEGFGLPVLEAMACGTPVITSNLASLPEITKDAALLIDPYNVKEITDAMYQLAGDLKLRQQLKQAGIQQASQFSWEKTGVATAEILRQFC